MTTELSGLFQLRNDVLIVPVMDLPEESRAQFEFDTGDFAVSRMQSRNGSKIIGAEAADVLGRFKEPRSVVEAVILFGREKNFDPDQVLGDAYPFLQSMVEAGFLVRSSDAVKDAGDSSQTATWGAGSTVLDARVVRTFQVFDDTEVLMLSRRDGRHSVLKVERQGADGAPAGHAKARLEHEAAVMRSLDGNVVPRVLSEGMVDNRSYIETEFIAGVDSAAAASEWRQREGDTARRKLLALAQAITHAYVSIHARGVIHGDVHPRNVLVLGDDSVRLIDFGMAVSNAATTGPFPMDRGGMPFFFEPELAQAYFAAAAAPPASASGEQHGVAALIYFLITGAYWQDFRLGRKEMMEDIVAKPPLSFTERGVQSWPAMEAVLQRALAKSPSDRFASMADFAAALGGIVPLAGEPRVRKTDGEIARLTDYAIANASPDGPWAQGKLAPAPATSINYGSAGVALGLLHIAQQRRDAGILSLASSWSLRSLAEMGDVGAFYNADIQITPELVGETSPYHSPGGVHAVAALVATAMGAPLDVQRGLSGFLDSARRPVTGLDLTLGQSSVLLGSAILLDALRATSLLEAAPLRETGDAALQKLWAVIDAKPPIADSDIEYLGIAHGWAGILYATLQWCRVSGSALPANVEQRLDELAALALPTGRGVEWPWLMNRPGEPMTMAGWCNGTCGYVFLWNLAHRQLAHPRYLELARGAAMRSWDADEPSETLCCGLAGRGYALLNMYRSSGDAVWIDRARDLILRASRGAHADDDYAHSLYKGRFGLAVLAAELEHPDESVTPFFEPSGYVD
jgi:serine/threonine-protein kinase